MNRLYSAIYVGSRWKIQDRRQIKNDRSTQTKHNPGKANNAKHSTTKLLWGLVAIYGTRPENTWLILQCFWAHMGPLYTVQNRVLLCAENDRLNRQTNSQWWILIGYSKHEAQRRQMLSHQGITGRNRADEDDDRSRRREVTSATGW